MAPRGGSKKKMYFDEDKGGFVMQPETVLFASLAFIGIVIMLHISNKFFVADDEEMPDPEAQTEL
jgi:hypothetical protein